MLPGRKRERGAVELDGENAPRSGGALKRAATAVSTAGAMQPRVVNLMCEPTLHSAAPLPRSPPPPPSPSSTAGGVQLPREAAVSAHSSASASPRSSNSTSSASARVLSRRGRPQQPLQPPSARTAASSAQRGAVTTTTARGRSIAGVPPPSSPAVARAPATTAVAVATTHGANSGSSAAPSAPRLSAAERGRRRVWRAKREGLEREVAVLSQYSDALAAETLAVEDAVEDMLSAFEEDKARVETRHRRAAARYHLVMDTLRAREDACLAAKQRALDQESASRETVKRLQSTQETTQEAIVLATEERDRLGREVETANSTAAEAVVALQRLQREEERMKDATYGLSGEVKEMVQEMERLRTEKRRIGVLAMEAEVARRGLYSLCEEVKGSIRVYCRVKGVAPPRTDVAGDSALAHPPGDAVGGGGGRVSGDAVATACAAAAPPGRQPSRSGSLESSLSVGVRMAGASSVTASAAAGGGGGLRSGRSTTRSSVATASVVGEDAAEAAAASVDEATAASLLYSYPDRSEAGGAADTAPAPPLLLASNTTEAPAAAVPPCGLPYGSGRSITIHQTRSNATSTGRSSVTETFTYDRVFTGAAPQAEVYRDVEPLVRNAVDGYRVCIFAYGQTGSGKTFTMEGDVRGTPEMHGVTPRALQTVLTRQAELADEGWSYALSCTFVEIYNDVIRDLFQCGSARYEAALQSSTSSSPPPPPLLLPSSSSSSLTSSGAGAAVAAGTSSSPATATTSTTGGSSSAAAYHTIKHNGDRTVITNVVERRVRSMDEFLQLYRHAVLQRSTAKTDLNDASSRSHCVFTLHIVGTNATIRQRSDGVLCLVDLAGSERVNESGVQGLQFKEAVKINRSLLDLGECIRALRCGAVVPWRNCKLTYLLQNYLGAKGGKMLMIVTVSNARAHAPESLNSLRFAARVQETYVGTSVKRVTNM
ncbi:C-terminal motor kinesin [Novymonas esmeraldas]|uniref:Kinesin-like protein n=1 Tax=Novymonas esmeraldas TaxID=1808958 RepID=A0AAW0EN32_9TRYP